jgi:2-succinyl-6-hydroxy-2,4-cyclohexadiene-1-carboxylate synthase
MLSYSITGSVNHPPLVFLHGFLGVKEDWEEVIDLLKDRYCCYALDLPGHGESPYEEHFMESIFVTIHTLKIPPSPIIGYSMGGRLALFLKEYFPKQFKELVLLGAHPGLTDEASKRLRWYQDLNWSMILDTQPFETFLCDWYAQPLFNSLKKRPELYHKLLQRRSKQNPQNMASIMRNFSLSLQPALTKFHSDTLFLYGDEDSTYADLYQNHLPKNTKVEKIEGGHILLLENPKEVAKNIEAFIK